MIVAEYAAQSLATRHASGRNRAVVRGFDELIRQSLMVSLSVVVRDVLAQQLTQVMLAQRDHFRQATSTRREPNARSASQRRSGSG
jgi:hypothetical protein